MLNIALHRLVDEHLSTDFSFEVMYCVSYKLTRYGPGADIQFILQSAVRAIMFKPKPLRSTILTMLRCVNKYHQVLNRYHGQPCLEKLAEIEETKRTTWAVAVIDKFKAAWIRRYYMPETGGFVVRSAKAWSRSGVLSDGLAETRPTAEKRERNATAVAEGGDRSSAKRCRVQVGS